MNFSNFSNFSISAPEQERLRNSNYELVLDDSAGMGDCEHFPADYIIAVRSVLKFRAAGRGAHLVNLSEGDFIVTSQEFSRLCVMAMQGQ